MYGLNKVTLIGHVGQDPELKQANGASVISFSLATNESYKDQNGTLVERTEWHRCTAWRKAAETLAAYVKKGSKLYVEGKLQTRKYDKDGQTHYATEIVVSEFMFLDSKGASSQRTDAPAETYASSAESADLPF